MLLDDVVALTTLLDQHALMPLHAKLLYQLRDQQLYEQRRWMNEQYEQHQVSEAHYFQ